MAPAGSSERIIVGATGPLEGRVVISGAKNSVLKLMAATCLAEGTFVLRNVPNIADVACRGDLLASMGMTVTRTAAAELTIVHPPGIVPEARDELVERIVGPRSWCWARSWPATVALGRPCRVAMTSGRV